MFIVTVTLAAAQFLLGGSTASGSTRVCELWSVRCEAPRPVQRRHVHWLPVICVQTLRHSCCCVGLAFPGNVIVLSPREAFTGIFTGGSCSAPVVCFYDTILPIYRHTISHNGVQHIFYLNMNSCKWQNVPFIVSVIHFSLHVFSAFIYEIVIYLFIICIVLNDTEETIRGKGRLGILEGRACHAYTQVT